MMVFGFVLIGKDDRKILVLDAYNVPRNTPPGDNALHAKQTSLCLVDGEMNPNTRNLSI